MKAFVLAGGAGTRLAPVTTYVPKCMIPISGRPFIDYVVLFLAKHGIRDVVMLVSDQDFDVFRNHLENGSKFGAAIDYNVSRRMGTSAALRDAADQVEGTFIVYYGDVLASLDLGEMIRFHKSKGAVCTVALSTGVKIDYGVGRVDRDGRIEYFAEKPVLPEYPVSIGVYVCEPGFLQYLSLGSDLAGDVLPRLLERDAKFYGFLTRNPHLDIGSFKQLAEAQKFLQGWKSSME